MATLRAFFDDSADRASLALAGYVGTDRAWQIFEPEWKAALERHGIPYFHMKEIPDPKSPMHKFYGKENGEKLTALLGDLANVLSKCWGGSTRFCGIGCVVPLDALDKFNRDRNRNIDPLALAIYTCAGLMQNEFPKQPIEALIDKLTKPHKSLGLAHEYAASNPRQHMRESSIKMIPAKEPISSRTVRALQAADFAAYEGRKQLHRFNPFFCDVDLSNATENMHIWYEYQNWLEANNRPQPDQRKSLSALGPVGIQDSHPGLIVIQALNGPIRFD